MPSFARRLRDNESGNVLAICAGLMPLLMGSAALAVDAAQLALWKRQLQRTADSGAIAGAYTLAQDGDDAEVTTSVNNDIDENPHPPLQTVNVDAGPQSGFQEAVTVSLTSQRTLPFANIFTNRPTTIAADATAALVPEGGDFCMVSLYDEGDPGIVITGNATVTLGCGMVANSVSDTAVTATGSSEVTASPIGAVGGLPGSTNNYVGGTTLLPYVAPQPDPLASLPDPSGCTGGADVSSNNGDVIVLGGETLPASGIASCSSSWDLKPGGTIELRPGTHIIYGGTVDLKGTLRTVPGPNGEPAGATVILTGPNGQAGSFTSNSQATIQIIPPSSGTFKDVSFYRDRRAAYQQIHINGGSDSIFRGAYYFRTADLLFNGNASITSTCLQMVGRKLTFSGTFDLVNNCPPGGGNANFSRRIVRLVE